MDSMVPYTIGLHIGNSIPFLYTPTSLLPEHSLLTDVQQATGRNGQQWITCRGGRDGGLAAIHGNVSMSPTYSMGDQTTILTLSSQNLPQNGQYYCLAGERKYNFNLFLRKQSKDNINGCSDASTHQCAVHLY